MGSRARWILLILGAVYAAIIVVSRMPYGGDIVPEIALSQRWLDGAPLYRPALSAYGTPWPPFAAVVLVPLALLARVSLPVATAAWSVFSVACLVAALALARRWGWKTAIIAVLATAVPIQTNFEHRNVNTVLLALVVAAAADLEDARDARAGLWLGLATAIKAFPALLLVYLAVRGQWRALAVATAVAAGGTLLALAPYGPAGGGAAAADWLGSSFDQGRWLIGPSNQSLHALVLRLGGTPPVAAGLAALCVGGALLLARFRARGVLPGLGATTLAAILATPIAWVHYYVLAFPAWAAVAPGFTGRLKRGRDVAFVVAALATSGWLTVGPRPLRQALLGERIYAWGALVLLALLAWRLLERANGPTDQPGRS